MALWKKKLMIPEIKEMPLNLKNDWINSKRFISLEICVYTSKADESQSPIDIPGFLNRENLPHW